MKRSFSSVFTLVVACIGLATAAPALAQYEITRSVVGSGAGNISDANNTVRGTAGQAATGIIQSGSQQNQVGFWYGLQSNRPPVAAAGPDQALTCLTDAMYVTFDGSASTDPDNDELAYVWSENGQTIATGVGGSALLPVGVHTVDLTVDDGNGGTATDQLVVSISLDNSNPLVTITSPLDGAWTRSGSINVTGSVLEDFKLNTVTVNGKNSRFIGPQPNYTYTRSAALPEEGANLITVEVTDIAGNSAQTSITVNRDTTDPAIAINLPTLGSTLTTSPVNVTVEGPVSDTGSGIASVEINGVAATINGATYSAVIELKGEGYRRVLARATDLAGNRTDAELQVMVDSRAPSLAIQSPSNNSLVEGPNATVIGTANDNGSGIASVTVNGQAAALQGNNYSATIALASGEQAIEVVAVDSAGHSTTKNVAVQVGAGGSPTLALTLTDSQDQPIAGQRVDLLRENGSGTGNRSNTDVNGQVNFEVEAGTNYNLRITHNGLTWTTSASVAAGANIAVQTELSELTFTDVASAPIEGVRVDLLRANDTGAGQRVNTDANGVAAFEILPGALHGFKVTYSGEDASVSGLVGGQDAAMSTESSVLTLLTEAGAPLEGVRVDLLRADSTGTGKRVDTDAQGQAAFEVLSTFAHRFKISLSGDTFITDAIVGGSDLTVHTERSVLTFANEASAPLEGVRVDLLRANNTGAGERVDTDAKGQAAFEVLPGAEHSFRIIYNGGTSISASVIGGEDIAVQTANSALTLTDHTGAPIDSVRVDLMRANGTGAGQRENTNAAGVAGFEIVPGYEHAFKVSYNGGVWVSGAVNDGVDLALQTQLSQLELKDQNQNPVVGARVDLLTFDSQGTGQRMLTDLQGLAGFETLPDCSSRFKITYNGDSFVTDPVPCGQVTTLELQVAANSVALELKDSQDAPIEGARVDILREDGRGTGVRADTDAAGRVEFTVVPEAKQQLRVSYNGGTWTSGVVNAGAVVPVQTVSSSLVFTSSSAVALGGVRVDLLRDNGSGAGVRTDTDSTSGVSAFEVLPDVEHRFKVSYNCGALVQPALEDAVLTVSAGATSTLALSSVPSTLTLTDSQNAPIEGVRVDLLRANLSGAGVRVDTDAAGVSAFEVLPTMEHFFRVSYNGGTLEAPASAVVIAAGGTNNVDVQTVVSSLALSSSVGDPLEGVRVDLLRDNGSGAGVRVNTDVAGVSAFEVLPDMLHRFKVSYRGGTYVQPLVGDVPEAALAVAAGASNAATIQTQARVLTLRDGGVVLVNTRVDLLRANESGAGANERTDENGQLAFEVLPDFAHKLRARVGGENYLTDELVGGGSTVYDINPLPPGKLVASDGSLITGLDQNYPNPFNPTTMIRYALAEAMDVELVIYNALGQEVVRLASGYQGPGMHRLHWDGRNANGYSVAPGIYIYRLQAGERVETRKMLLAK